MLTPSVLVLRVLLLEKPSSPPSGLVIQHGEYSAFSASYILLKIHQEYDVGLISADPSWEHSQVDHVPQLFELHAIHSDIRLCLVTAP